MTVTEKPRPVMVLERAYRAQPQELWDLWTTKDGFESWWGPEGFRVEVQRIEPRDGGKLDYDMIADAPEQIAAMKRMGMPVSHPTHGWYEQMQPLRSLVLKHMIDFIPGLAPYESTIDVDFVPAGDRTRMVMTLHPMHSEEMSGMQRQGFESQLTKLDRRFA